MKKYATYTAIALVIAIIGIAAFVILPRMGDTGDRLPQNNNVSPAEITPSDQKTDADGGSMPVHQPKTARSTSIPPPPPTAVPAKNQGRLVLAMTDEAVKLDELDALFLYITSLDIHAKTGWTKISLSQTRHDLLALDRAGAALAVLADIPFEPGEYNKLRLIIEKIVIQKGGLLHEAKLPSGEIIFNGKIAVEKEKTSAVILDFLADQSLFVAGNGKYIFLPVVHFTSYSNLSNQQLFERRANMTGGKPEHDITIGVAPTGEVKQNFRVDPSARLELIGTETIRLIQRDEKTTDYAVTADEAVAIALKNRYVAEARSITTGTRDGKPVWVVSGPKGGVFKSVFVSVYIDGATGQVLSLE